MWTLEVHSDEDSASGGDNQSGNQPVWVGRRWTKEAKVGWRLRNGGGHVGLNAHSTGRLSSLSLEFALPPSLSPTPFLLSAFLISLLLRSESLPVTQLHNNINIT